MKDAGDIKNEPWKRMLKNERKTHLYHFFPSHYFKDHIFHTYLTTPEPRQQLNKKYEICGVMFRMINRNIMIIL